MHVGHIVDAIMVAISEDIVCAIIIAVDPAETLPVRQPCIVCDAVTVAIESRTLITIMIGHVPIGPAGEVVDTVTVSIDKTVIESVTVGIDPS